LVVLHDLPLATRFCDRLILIHHGKIAADGDAETVLTPERLAEVYGIEAQASHEGGRRVVVPLRRIGRAAG
jgi:iron complex transport system ATP-binding protein